MPYTCTCTCAWTWTCAWTCLLGEDLLNDIRVGVRLGVDVGDDGDARLDDGHLLEHGLERGHCRLHEVRVEGAGHRQLDGHARLELGLGDLRHLRYIGLQPGDLGHLRYRCGAMALWWVGCGLTLATAAVEPEQA